MAQLTNPKQLNGEIFGSFLAGIVSSIGDIYVLPEDQLPFNPKSLEPTGWYPFSNLVDTINLIETTLPHSSSILFWAGVRFFNICYWNSPGKEKIHSGMDWLYANSESGGYNDVVRGGGPNEIGWCKILSMDEPGGVVIYEHVSPIKGEYLKGVFYGGCIMFNDLAYFSVESIDEAYDKNPNFIRTIITVRFHLKSKFDIETKLEDPTTIDPNELTIGQTEDLLWCHKRLVEENNLLEYYREDMTKTLKSAFKEMREMIADLKVANDKAEKMAADLKKALVEVKTLSGMLPICSLCKKIRDDKGYWNQIESYIKEHSEADFSHSLCPGCSDKMYGNEDWYIELRKERPSR